MLVLSKNSVLLLEINGKEIGYTQIYTSSDIKKIAKEKEINFLTAVEDMILVGIDDNGNNYYVSKEYTDE